MKCNYKEEINHLYFTIESSESLIESSESLVESTESLIESTESLVECFLIEFY